ncbi:hypothetical protein ACEE44_00835 [Streptococcus sp. 32226D021BW]
MNYVYRMLFSFLLVGLFLYLAATVFAQCIWQGPLLITFSFLGLIYGCVMLYKWKPKAAKIIFECVGNFLSLPWS